MAAWDYVDTLSILINDVGSAMGTLLSSGFCYKKTKNIQTLENGDFHF